MPARAPPLWLREVRNMLPTAQAACSNLELTTVRYSFHYVATELDTKIAMALRVNPSKETSINNPNKMVYINGERQSQKELET